MTSWKISESASISKTISESDVYMFAGITGDFNPMHVNEEKSKKGIFGERIVHGILVTGLISAVIGTKIPGEGAIYMEQDVRFLKPVKIGDTVTATVEIVEIISEEKGILKLNTTVKNQREEQVIDGYAIVKVPLERKKDDEKDK